MSNILHRLFKQERPAATSDGFITFSEHLRGMGNRNDFGYFRTNALTSNPEILNTIYRNSWLCAKVIDCLAEDMTKDGIKINGLEEPQNGQLQAYLTRMNLWRDLTNAIKWARLYGGACCFINIAGQDTETPLDISSIAAGQFSGLIVLDRYRINPETTVQGEEPEYYYVPEMGNLCIHKSRLIKFIGVELPYNLAIQEQFWGDSVVARIYDRICMRDSAIKSSAKLINHAWLRTVKVKDMRMILGGDERGEQNLTKFFRTLVDMQDSTGITLLDADDEFQTNSYSFSGLEQLLRTYDQDVAGAADIPITRLYGQSPAGFSTGESDLKTYYDKVSSLQESMLREPLTTLISVCFQSYFGAVPEEGSLDFEFLSPWQPSEIEERSQAVAEVGSIIQAAQAGLINVDTAMKELRSRGKRSGLFGSITDEDIALTSEAGRPPEFDFDEELNQPLQQEENLEEGLSKPLQ